MLSNTPATVAATVPGMGQAASLLDWTFIFTIRQTAPQSANSCKVQCILSEIDVFFFKNSRYGFLNCIFWCTEFCNFEIFPFLRVSFECNWTTVVPWLSDYIYNNHYQTSSVLCIFKCEIECNICCRNFIISAYIVSLLEYCWANAPVTLQCHRTLWKWKSAFSGVSTEVHDPLRI